MNINPMAMMMTSNAGAQATATGGGAVPVRMKGMSGDELSALSTERFVSIALDEAIAALATLDADRLEAITANVAAMVASRPLIEATAGVMADRAAREEDLREVMARHRLLGHLLETTSLNLSVLQGLRRRNSIGGDLWVR